MKTVIATLFSILIVSAMVMSGCQAKDPVSTQGTRESNGLTRTNGLGSILDRGDDVLFKLPKSDSTFHGIASMTKLVTPDSTTTISRTLSYRSTGNQRVQFSAKLTIPAGAVSDTVSVTMILDTAFTMISFFPEGLQFTIPAKLDVSIMHLDPIARSTFVEFLYVNPDGTYGSEQFESLNVTGNDGVIIMKGGKLRHFSAYGWGRRSAVAPQHLTD